MAEKRTYYREGNCIWALHKKTHLQGHKACLPGFPTDLRDENDPFLALESFDFPPLKKSKKMPLEDYLKDYKGHLSPDPQKEVHQIEADSHSHSLCELCDLSTSCPVCQDFHCETEVFVTVDPDWENSLKPNGMARKETKNISLKDIRWNNRPVTLVIKRPRWRLKDFRFYDELPKSMTMDLRPLQFFSHNITTRAVASIAKLYNSFSPDLICDGYNLKKSTFFEVLQELKSHISVETQFDTLHFKIHKLLNDSPVEFIFNADDCSLVSATIVNHFKLSPHITSLITPVTFAPSAFGKDICFPQLSVADVYEYLYLIFRQVQRKKHITCKNMESSDLFDILESSFSALHDTCVAIESQLKSGLMNQSAAEEQLFRQLRILSVLADTPSRYGYDRLFPELVDAIGRILYHEFPVNLSPFDYSNNLVHNIFDWEINWILDEINTFIQEVTESLPDNADISVALDRLAIFNDPTTMQISFDLEDRLTATSKFNLINLQSFEGTIHIQPPEIACLTHLIRYGLLDTDAPVLNLPCIQDRLQNQDSAACKLPACPLLSRRKY